MSITAAKTRATTRCKTSNIYFIYHRFSFVAMAAPTPILNFSDYG